MTSEEIMQFLKEHENPDAKTVLMRHGARDPFYGVRYDMTKVIDRGNLGKKRANARC